MVPELLIRALYVQAENKPTANKASKAIRLPKMADPY